ncbi:MAG: hypothetical protein JXB23_00155 [Candidatus Aminicenantes bacterium]|nr:hypothetical protein [Candidatus Aminicenantes bacterium]
MKRGAFIAYLSGGIIIASISLYGFTRLHQRPGLPLEWGRPGIRQLDGIKITSDKDVEFVLSQRNIGDKVRIVYEDRGSKSETDISLISFYSQTPFPTIYLVIGIICLLIGAVVFVLRPEEISARVFYLAILAFSSATIISHGFFYHREDWISFLPGILFYALYPLAPALLLHFILLLFRSDKAKKMIIIYLPAIFISCALISLFLYATLKSSIIHFRYYQAFYLIFRYYIVIYVLASIVSLVLSYRKMTLMEEKAQVKWIFFGILIGLGPFIVLYQLPQLFRLSPLISEEFSSVFFIFLPLAFAFSIVRFRLMDIELIINRSLVYSLLTIFTVSVYLFSVRILQELISSLFTIREAVVAAIAALAAAAAFHPTRHRIQQFVDKSFFRIAYDYRESIRSFNENAHKIADTSHLVDYFQVKLSKTIPVEHIGILVLVERTNVKNVLIQRNEEKNLELLAFSVPGITALLARKKALQTEMGADFSRDSMLEKMGLEIVLPIPFSAMTLSGCVALGKKMSGARFSRDDLDLLMGFAENLAVNLERITLHEAVILERAEKEKLDELNRLKTEFITTVSHELRTPMSSLLGLSELLQEGKIKDKALRGKMLSAIAEECSRLTRFLHNILDIGKIEQDVKTYNMTILEVQCAIEETLHLFHGQLESEGFRLHKELPPTPVFIRMDRDSVKQALTNILDNAIKYSHDKRDITIRLVEENKKIAIQIRDKGIGIASSDQKKIFENFFRTKAAIAHCPRGVGLGLKVVGHIMAAHRGQVTVKSRPGEGSTFTLNFPKP